MRTIDCPYCQRRLNFPEGESGQFAVCPGCGDRFLIARQDAAWRSQIPGEAEAIQSARPADTVGEVPPPDELEEPKELARSIVSDKQSFYVDVDGWRTRLMQSAFKVAFGGCAFVGILLALITERTIGGMLQALLVTCIVGLLVGFCAAFLAGLAVAPTQADRQTGQQTIERQREEARKGSRKLTEAGNPDEGQRDAG